MLFIKNFPHRININISQVGEFVRLNTFLSINAIWLIEIRLHEVTSGGPSGWPSSSERRIGVLRVVGRHTVVGGPKEGADPAVGGRTRPEAPVAVRIILARAQFQWSKIQGVRPGGRRRRWVWQIGIFVHIIANGRRHQLRSWLQQGPRAHAPLVPPEFRPPILKPNLKHASE